MSPTELERLVDKIVHAVVQRIEQDEELAPLLGKQSPAVSTNQSTTASTKQTSWARTCSSYRETPKERVSASPKVSVSTKKLYTERDILEMAKNGQSSLVVSKQTIITPAARDAAKLKDITITIH